jgi:hypothetical protein
MVLPSQGFSPSSIEFKLAVLQKGYSLRPSSTTVVTPWPVQDNHKKPLKKTIKPGVRHTAPRGLHNTQSERGKTLNVLKKNHLFNILHLYI